MGKPTLFIDSPNPFKDNFLMKPHERIGYLCSDSNELSLNIDEAINDTEKYHSKYDEINHRYIRYLITDSTNKCSQT